VFLGADVSFDKGGIGSQQRLNPVRQYNKNKPQKFCVDFFVMAWGRTYFIHHIDVYQGANATNTGIHRACRALPTTQKAVLKALLHTNKHNEVHGARDNQYQCPELAFLLKTKLKINSMGTCKVGRKGWNKHLIDLTHKMPRGTYKILIDKNNGVLCCQWVDSHVVNVVSSILSNKITSVKRQVGSKKKDFDCLWVVTKYQKNMQGVDKSDQMRATFGGFAAKAHFRKLYK
jgi:Transposase IS4